MTMTTDMIQHALNKDYNKANEIFGEIMTQRVNDALDQEKIKLADQIYNGAEEEQLELDLEDDDVGEEDNIAQSDEESETEDLQEPDNDAELEMGDEDDEDDDT
jgi:hypothetical protein